MASVIIEDSVTPILTPETRSPRSARYQNLNNETNSNHGSDISECSICLCSLNNNRLVLECGHSLHFECFESYLANCYKKKVKPTCTLCRKVLTNYNDIDYERYGIMSENIQETSNHPDIINLNEQTQLIVSHFNSINNRNTYSVCQCDFSAKNVFCVIFMIVLIGFSVFFIIKF